MRCGRQLVQPFGQLHATNNAVSNTHIGCSTIITLDQRPEFVPFITRVAYGRFAVRASKEEQS